MIFTEPHAYISPSNYEKIESVPTWDYISVHAYGNAKIITDADVKLKELEKVISFYEPSYLKQWDELSVKFKSNMMKGIVLFQIEVERLEAQKKLSQNKMPQERESIKEQLKNSNRSAERDIAKYINKL